jgi:phospholipid/cholesterol/gamma-HCH transport system substrate-binding protein
MERNANYALVGLISTILLMGLVVFIVWLAGSGLTRQYDLYDIVFQGPVRGLSQGAEVHFNGIKVGEVSKITLDPKDTRLVIARAQVTSDVPIRVDSYATLEPLGITGVNYMDITAGSVSKPLLKDTVPNGHVPVMYGRRDALSDLLAGGGYLVQKSVETLDRVNRIFSDDNIKALSLTLGNIQEVTAELKDRKSLIDDAQKTLRSADAAMRQIHDLAASSQTLLEGDGKGAIDKIGAAADEMEGATKDLRALLKKFDGPAGDFANNGLPQITASLISLQRSMDHLDQLLGEVQSNPRGVIAKPMAKQIEVKP